MQTVYIGLIVASIYAFYVVDVESFFASDHVAGHIVNGTVTKIELRPYQVSLQSRNGRHFCGGSIISEDIIVTAAHCLAGANTIDLRIRLGSTVYDKGGELVSVKAIKIHELYNDEDYTYDIAVIKLASPVRQSAKVRFIEMTKKVPKTGTPSIVSGWGTTCFLFCDVSNVLREVEVSFLERRDCASDQFEYGSKIMESMVCAYTETKDSCQGDSGGPLVANNKLVGVVSWGQGCAKKDFPGVYSDVSMLRDWVLKTAQTL